MKRLSVLLSLCAALAPAAMAQQAPKVDEKRLRAAFDERLKDAESARFRAIRQQPSDAEGMWTVCGEVNAKSSMGGYAGYTPFYAVVTKDKGKPVEYLVLGVGESSGMLCEKKFGG